MNARLLLIHALSPLHAGTGQGVGAIDLPIARERATNLPFLPGSSIKGVLRDACGRGVATSGAVDAIFGPTRDQADAHAGSVQFSDARLVLFPVRSLSGTFAWATSPMVLARLRRDAVAAGLAGLPLDVITPGAEACVVTGESCVSSGGLIVLEDLDLTAVTEGLDDWAAWLGSHLFPGDDAWAGRLRQRLCLLPDDVFDFLVETATEVTARIGLDQNTKTVSRGALWYEESLPSESVLVGIAVHTPVGKTNGVDVFGTIRSLVEAPVQLGGKSTVGRGLCRVTMVDGEAAR
ncbi:MAG: type III-B CRISPR module RAMP protein Cmr4 [Acidobacteria bacterium]|nr:type III-B CRISPR module RAMP protein Cmr4 [Acidobacteriota bacterium]